LVANATNLPNVPLISIINLGLLVSYREQDQSGSPNLHLAWTFDRSEADPAVDRSMADSAVAH
jgi:hypothetical protein